MENKSQTENTSEKTEKEKTVIVIDDRPERNVSSAPTLIRSSDDLKGNKRLENESFDQYKVRRNSENAFIKRMLRKY